MPPVCQNRRKMIDSAVGDHRLAGHELANGTYRPLTTVTTAMAASVNCSEDQLEEAELVDKDRHALLYIVVVLLFYSLGIIIAIVMYLKREKEEVVQEKAYDDYMNFRANSDKWARYFRVQQMIFHLNKVERARDKRVQFENNENKRLMSGSSAEEPGPSSLGLTKQYASMQAVSGGETPSPDTKKHRCSLPNLKTDVEVDHEFRTKLRRDQVTDTKLNIAYV